MQSIPSTAEESATPSLFRMAPRVLSAIIEGFTLKGTVRPGMTSIIVGAKGWFATNTHRLVWSGQVPMPEDAKATDLLSAKLEIVRADHCEDLCDLTNLQEASGSFPNVRRVLGHDFFPVFDLSPVQLLEIANLAEASGAERITICSRAEMDCTSEAEDGNAARVVGFRLRPATGEAIYCIAMGYRPDGIRPAVQVITKGNVPAIKGIPAEAPQSEAE